MRQRTKKKKKRGKILLVFVAAAIIGLLAGISSVAPGEHFTGGNGAGSAPDSSLSEKPASSVVSAGNLYSPHAILVSLDDQNILMQKNSNEKIYPASLTKMMTAMVAIENLPDLQEQIQLPGSLFQELHDSDATLAGFQAGERVRAIDLLFGTLLPSGAECSMGLACYIAGSEPNFVKLMNQRALQLGMNNTHFTNATGLHDINHYTTVRDQAVLLRYALKNKTFREIFTSSRHTTSPTNKHPGGITFYSTLFENLSAPEVKDGRILGGKTGYTNEAGLCLASVARVNGREYVLVTAGAKGDHKSEQYNITDALAVYNRLGN